MMNLKANEVYTIKLNSGEELITKIIELGVDDIVIDKPLSVAPGPQGVGLMPSMFTAGQAAEVRLNKSSIAFYALTDDNVKSKYIESVTGIRLPEKKLVLG